VLEAASIISNPYNVIHFSQRSTPGALDGRHSYASSLAASVSLTIACLPIPCYHGQTNNDTSANVLTAKTTMSTPPKQPVSYIMTAALVWPLIACAGWYL
jgi:hypothetical protein